MDSDNKNTIYDNIALVIALFGIAVSVIIGIEISRMGVALV